MADQRLSNVIGAPFPEYVLTQLNIRAARNSTGTDFVPTRSNEELLFLANKSAWVKLTSSVRIVPPPGVQSLLSFYNGLGFPAVPSSPDELRKNWILEAGTSTSSGGAGINLRKGLGPEGSYGMGGTEELGYRPMPGLISATIDTTGTLGSLRQANINFKVWNMNQLNTIEALYFRLGYSMLLEWGHTQFFTNARQGENLGGTFNTNTYGIDPFTNPRKEVIQQNIANRSVQLSGNYDGMLGIVTNFNWSFNQEGGYDCSIKLIGLGSIIDTLRINLSYKMPGILFEKFRKEQKRIRDFEAEDKARKEREAKVEEQKKINAAAAATVAESRRQQKLPPAPIPAAKNPSEIYTVVAKADYGSVAIPLNEENWLIDHAIFSHYQYQLSSKAPGDLLAKPVLNQVADYYYKAEASTNDLLKAEMNGLTSGSAGLYLNNAQGTKRSKWQLVPAGVSVGNGQRASIFFDFLNNGVAGYVFRNENPIGTIDIKGIDAKTLANVDYTKNQYPSFDTSTTFFRPFENYIRRAPSGINPADTQNILITDSQELRYAYTALTYESGKDASGKFRTSNKIFYIDVEYRPSTSTVKDSVRSILVALETWAKTGAVVSIEDMRSFKQVNVNLGRNSIFNDIEITVKLENLGLRGQVYFKFNNPTFIKEVLPNIPPSATAQNQTSNAASGDTGGTINTSSTVQTDPSDKFASSLHAMLSAVKSFMQDKAYGGTKGRIFKESITDITKVMYQDGVLKDVFTTGSVDIKPNSQTFDVTAYAKKGFNSNLMLDPKIAATVPNVDFDKLCTAYAIKYTQAESDTSINYPIYIKLGYLMSFLNSMCLIYDSTVNQDKHPYVYLDFNPDTNFCLTLPQHLSVDPFTCIIPFQGTNQDYLDIYPPIKEFQQAIKDPLKETDNVVSAFLPSFKSPNNQYQGKTMEILLNVDYLLSVVTQYTSTDKEHAVYLKGFLDSIVAGINKSTGTVNLFRVSYRDDSNTVIIKDDQFVPPADGEVSMMVRGQYLNPGPNGTPKYGQLPVFGAQSLVRAMDFRTDISTKMSSMIAISGQAQTGSFNSKDNTPLSYLNPNYVDAYKPRINDATDSTENTNLNNSKNVKQSAQGGENANNDIEQAQQFNNHILNVYVGSDTTPIAKDKIDFATNYYIERMSKVKAENKITQSAPFIPANINLTIDGIAGIVMGNAFTIPEDRLPTSLKGDDGQTKVGFIVVGLTNVLENNQWLTKIRGQMIKLRDNAEYGAAQQIKATQRTFGSFNAERSLGTANLSFLNLNADWVNIAFNYIAKNETFIAKAKWDYNKYRAGYGSDTFVTVNGDVLPVEIDTVLTKEDAERTLKYNITGPFKNGVVAQIGQARWDALSATQKAALISYTYNAGAGALATWGIKRAIQADASKEEVAALIARGPITAYDTRTGKTDTLDGLIRRRREESQLYIS